MPEPKFEPARPWQTIAEEISREQDAKKMLQLIEELNQAFKEQPPRVADARLLEKENKRTA